jgi:hypothetical protein
MSFLRKFKGVEKHEEALAIIEQWHQINIGEISSPDQEKIYQLLETSIWSISANTFFSNWNYK